MEYMLLSPLASAAVSGIETEYNVGTQMIFLQINKLLRIGIIASSNWDGISGRTPELTAPTPSLCRALIRTFRFDPPYHQRNVGVLNSIEADEHCPRRWFLVPLSPRPSSSCDPLYRQALVSSLRLKGTHGCGIDQTTIPTSLDLPCCGSALGRTLMKLVAIEKQVSIIIEILDGQSFVGQRSGYLLELIENSGVLPTVSLTAIISDEFTQTGNEDLLGCVDLVTVGSLCLIKPTKTSSVKPITLGASRDQVVVGLWVNEEKRKKDMKILTCLLREKSMLPDFHFHWRCGNTKSINLCFADDLMIFCKGELSSITLIQEALTEFQALSGLSPNPEKSSIYFSGLEAAVHLFCTLLFYSQLLLVLPLFGLLHCDVLSFCNPVSATGSVNYVMEMLTLKVLSILDGFNMLYKPNQQGLLLGSPFAEGDVLCMTKSRIEAVKCCHLRLHTAEIWGLIPKIMPPFHRSCGVQVQPKCSKEFGKSSITSSHLECCYV
ncbi:hypothetical protein RHSIM_Rhsim07G0147600 [Rhododendron simsii]|uniref:Uncharacterized protein n=1 Tax=Rhododendron simsii TaxID=118357 RepID=A0A834LFQ0_RHOSS|nr:hypothetical protein RHSIM_Rhsim07G0147600 [Rhododendron simsii]